MTPRAYRWILACGADRGIILDVGHGAGSLNFASAAGLLSAGIMPHVISTDLHQMSLHVGSLVSSDAVESPVIRLREDTDDRLDLPLCMSKFLALGVPLTEVVAAATSHPAAAVGLSGQTGSLRAGAAADIGLFRLVDGPVSFADVSGDVRTRESAARECRDVHRRLPPGRSRLSGHGAVGGTDPVGGYRWQ